MRLAARQDCGKPWNSQSFMREGQVKDLKTQCVEWFAPHGVHGMANVSPVLFSLRRKLIITDKHFAVPLFWSALRRVDDLDRRNQPAPEQPSHFGMIVQGKRSEEHTSELQSLRHLVCRLLLE